MKFKESTQPQSLAQAFQGSNRKVSLEELLQLKRAERPSAEFWTSFEQQLKQRQLASAIQEKRDWWQAIPRLALYVPVGATALIALSLVIWRNHGPLTPETAPAATLNSPFTKASSPALNADKEQITLTESKATAAQNAGTQPVPESYRQHAQMAFAVAEAPLAAGKAAESETRSTIVVAQPHETPVGYASVASKRPLNGLGSNIVSTKRLSTQALFTTNPIAESNLLTAKAMQETSDPLQSATSTYDASFQFTSTEPAASNLLGDEHRERLLAYAETSNIEATTTDNPRVTRFRERLTSRMNDKSLSDSISRFGATGGSLTIKF